MFGQNLPAKLFILLQVPAKPILLSRTTEPKTIEELLELNNATKYLDLLLGAGYDDIKFIGETSDEELKEIGIIDRAERQQVSCIYSNYCSLLPFTI